MESSKTQLDHDQPTKPVGNWKYTLGSTLDAWKKYPQQRSEFATLPPGPPIFVSGTHRSGTTWVAKMLAVPGLWYIHEPFNPNKNIWQESFTYVRDTDTNLAVDAMLQQILNGGLRQTSMNGAVDHSWMPLRMFKPPIQRIMIKDPLACLLTAYFVAKYDLQTLVLFRHPCGFVSSVTRLGWPTGGFLKEFLTRKELMDDHLSDFASLMEQYANENTVASAAVLHGVLNQVLWNVVQKHSLKYYLFEDLCRSPLESFQNIFTWLGLPYSDQTYKLHLKLCSGRSEDPKDYHPHAVERNSQAMTDSWKAQLSTAEITCITDIWDKFKIPLYDT